MTRTEPVEIRPASTGDAEGVVQLNEYWNQRFERGEHDAGFLRIRFSLGQVQSLIAEATVAVASNRGRVVGYYLANDTFHSPAITARRELVERLVREGQLEQARYVMQAQAAIAPDHQRRGLGRSLLNELKSLVRTRWDFLVGVVFEGNEGAKAAHQRSGWRLVTPLAQGWLVVTPTCRCG